MMGEVDLAAQLQKMQREWDERARENARFYVNTERRDWTDSEFFQSGERTVAEEILTDMANICQGRDPKQMTVLEIGCGAGRVTRALAGIFGRVYAVDISGEMVQQARTALSDQTHVRVVQNNGKDLAVLGQQEFDFVFSSIVFQHIPSREVIESYLHDVHARLRPGGLFKFQVQGGGGAAAPADGSWLGVTLTEEEARDMALRCGFDMRYCYGMGTQYFWLWYFRPAFLSRAWFTVHQDRLRATYRRERRRVSQALALRRRVSQALRRRVSQALRRIRHRL
jgi:cyclopropane fatty-acyl-phospholipid synthase-like methyltransferase